jgi:hypothetical protein
MHKTLAIGALFVLAALAVACSGNVRFTAPPPAPGTTGSSNLGASTPRETLLEKDIGVLEDVASTLSNIKNQNELNTAMPKLNDLLQKHKDINQEAQKLGAPTAQEKDAMARKYGDRIKTAKDKLTLEMVRVNQIPGAGDLYRRLAEFRQAF